MVLCVTGMSPWDSLSKDVMNVKVQGETGQELGRETF